MEISDKNINQSKKDIIEYEKYLLSMENNPMIKPQTFKDMFGYEILLYKCGTISFVGDRYLHLQ